MSDPPRPMVRPPIPLPPPPELAWSTEAADGLAASAAGRDLLIDYFATHCCGRNVAVGDLTVRWAAVGRDPGPDWLRLADHASVRVWLRSSLAPLFAAAGPRIGMRGWGPLRHPVVELADPAAWIDFLAACPTRSVFTA